jgi:DNA mismatch repair ATPase MutS
LYDPSLALSLGEPVVTNDAFPAAKPALVITGANRGGKSTFLRGIGAAQLMLQCGMFVPAASMRASLSTGLFTHYKREEDETMESGKFDEELRRMNAIVERLRPGAMVLMNESFASTNEREGSEIAFQIVTALIDSGVRVALVTHLYELGRRLAQERSPDVYFLRAERGTDGQRTFKLMEGPPLPTSYGTDLYRLIVSEETTSSRRR